MKEFKKGDRVRILAGPFNDQYQNRTAYEDLDYTGKLGVVTDYDSTIYKNVSPEGKFLGRVPVVMVAVDDVENPGWWDSPGATIGSMVYGLNYAPDDLELIDEHKTDVV
jgi:hypothetical protein